MKPQRIRRPIRFRGRAIESRAQKVGVFVCRLVVAVFGLIFFAIGLLVIKAGYNDDSWGLSALGGVLALGALGLIWAGFSSNGRDVCEAAVALLISR
jgi:hypothetical protein